MSLREFWQALHAVLIYDRNLSVAYHSTIRASEDEVRQQIANARGK